MGKQGIGAFVTVTAYFFTGIPISYYFMFKPDYEDGIRGLWFGPTFATFFMTVLYNVIIYFIDWPSLFKEIEQRRSDENAMRVKLAEKQN